MNELLVMLEIYWRKFIAWIQGDDDDSDLMPA